MVRLDVRVLRALILGLAAALLLAACGPGTSGSPAASGASPGASAGGSAAAGQPGGTIYILTQAEQIDQIDPQRVYTGEDIAFFASTMYRSLVTYKPSPDRAEGLTLVPDLATDLGTANADATQWKFTLKDGPKWQDGSPVTCEDVKYGRTRSRTSTSPTRPMTRPPPSTRVHTLALARISSTRRSPATARRSRST